MLIPWGSDAPLYHRPIATVVLIVLVRRRRSSRFRRDGYEDWTLEIGRRRAPGPMGDNLFMHWRLGPHHREHALPVGLRNHRRREAGLVGLHTGIPGHRCMRKRGHAAPISSRRTGAHVRRIRAPSSVCSRCRWSGRPGTRFTASPSSGFIRWISIFRSCGLPHFTSACRLLEFGSERLFAFGRDVASRWRHSGGRVWRSPFSNSNWSIARTGTSSP